jgi:DNA-binding response OmpR family regulator
MKRILIIEDDPAILLGLKTSLEEEHYDVVTAEDGEIGYQTAKSGSFDLLLLDLMLPSKNGKEICADLRRENVPLPIIMLTSKSEEADKVLGLELGADDYVTKPFSLRELNARIRALLRRSEKAAVIADMFVFGDIEIDFKKLEARKNGAPLTLSVKEFEILKYFIGHEGEVVTRNMLLDDVWGYDNYPTTRTVDNYILSIRKQIETNPSKPAHLLTIHTAGYKFMK